MGPLNFQKKFLFYPHPECSPRCLACSDASECSECIFQATSEKGLNRNLSNACECNEGFYEDSNKICQRNKFYNLIKSLKILKKTILTHKPARRAVEPALIRPSAWIAITSSLTVPGSRSEIKAAPALAERATSRILRGRAEVSLS